MKIVALRSSNILSIPSLSAVYLTCSEPGFIPKSDFVVRFFSTACFAIEAALVKSSYEEFVHDPIRPQSTFKGQSFSFALSPISETGVAKSGVKGPFRCGFSSERLISIN